MAVDGSLVFDSKINTSGFSRGVTDIRQQLSGLSGAVKKLGLVIGSVFAVKKIAEFGKAAIELGSDLAEVQNVVDVTFTTMADKVDEFAKNAAISAGLSETMAKQYVGTFGAMSKSFGFAEKDAYAMSTALTQLAGDVASFYNISQDEAYVKLKSVFTGETETLKDLGVVMTQSALDAYALANGFGKTTAKMTEQEKVALRYRFVMDQLSGSSGDFLRTSDGWANQVRVLKLQIDSLKATLGQGLINVFTPVLKLINTLIGKLAALANSFKAFTELVTGNKSSASAATGMETTADGYKDAADGAEKLAAATEDSEKATKKAKKAAEGYLSPLDTIHKMKADEEDGEKDTPSPTIGLGTEIENVDYGKLAEKGTAFDKIGNAVQAVTQKVKELAGIFKQGFFEGLGDYKPVIEGMKKDIASIGESLKEIFTDPAVMSSANRFTNQLALTLGQFTGSVASIGLTIAANLVGGIEKYLTQNKERIKAYFVNMFDVGTEILEKIGGLSVALADIFSVFGGDTAQQITANLIGIFAEVGMLASENAAKLGRDLLAMIAQPIIDNKEKIKQALEGTLEAIEPFTNGLLMAVQKIRDSVTEIYDQHLKPLFDSIATGLSEILSALLEGYNTYMAPVLQGLGEKFQALIEGPFGAAIDQVKEFIGKLVDALKILWEEVLVPLFVWIAENIMPVLSEIIGFIGTTALNVIGTVMEAIGNIADVLSGVIDFIVGIFTGDWEKAWNGVKEIFGGIWELIKGIVSGAWNAVKELTEQAITIISDVVSRGWSGIKAIIETTWELIKNIISAAAGIVQAIMAALSGWLSSAFSKDWSKTFGVLGGVIKGFFKNVKNIFDGIKKIFEGIVQFVTGVFSGNWKQAWEGVKTIFSGIWDSLVNVVKSPINLIIGALNGLLYGVQSMQNGIADALNWLQIDIPDWLQGLTGYSSFGFNISHWSAPQIPYLAKGAVIPPNAPFAAILGDQKQGRNIEAPEALIRKIVREESSAGTKKEAVYHIHLEIGGREVLEVVLNEGKLKKSRSGSNPFLLGVKT